MKKTQKKLKQMTNRRGVIRKRLATIGGVGIISLVLVSILYFNISASNKDKEIINTTHKVEVNEKERDETVVNNKTPLEDQKVEEVEDNILYLSLEADKYAVDAKLVEEKLKSWNYVREDNKKIAYLTFDDGPSKTVTPKILDVLRANDIKATFFVLGSTIEENKTHDILKDMIKDGHAIGNHGYSHRYDILYPNRKVDVQAFMNDIEKNEELLKSILGENFYTRVLRFPGGHNSWDTEAIDPILEKEGYVYIDWNTLNGDSESSSEKTVNELVNRLKETVSDIHGNNDEVVVLMHDKEGKEATAEALQEIIDYLKAEGYEFRTLK